MIQVVIHVRQGASRETKDALAKELTDVVDRHLPGHGPIEIWFREFARGTAFLAGKEHS